MLASELMIPTPSKIEVIINQPITFKKDEGVDINKLADQARIVFIEKTGDLIYYSETITSFIITFSTGTS